MDDTVNALTKLAQDLTARVEALETENSALKADAAALRKQASVAPSHTVSAEVVDATLERLVKVGALENSQLEASRKVLLDDPTAAHRVLQRVLDQQLQIKKAAADEQELYGGHLVNGQPAAQSPEDACLDRMMRTLGMN